MPLSDARKRANAKYNAKAYEQLITRVPRGKKADLQAHAAEHGESLNGFVNRAIDSQVERDKALQAFTVQPTGKEADAE